MAITLPDFKNAHFFWMTACGEIPSADEELVKWMENEKDQSVQFQTARGFGSVRMMIGGGSGKHVHFDILSPELASKNPKDVGTLDQIQEKVNRLMGKEVETNLRGGFKVKLDELPEGGIIRSLIFQTKTGNVAIKLNGAIFSIEGAPIQTISWQAAQDGTIAITLESELVKTNISEHYLTGMLSILEQTLNIFVLGKTQDETK